MAATTVRHLPEVKFPDSPKPAIKTQRSGPRKYSEPFSVTFSPDIFRPRSNSSDRFPANTFRKGGIRPDKYATRAATYGTPDVLNQLFSGKLPTNYFNDVCYGKQETSREFLYKAPVREREKELWEPKKVSRVKARHVIRDIQDARFRRRDSLDEQATRTGRELRRKTAHCLLTRADFMPGGLHSYLVKLDKDREKLVQKVKQRQKATGTKGEKKKYY